MHVWSGKSPDFKNEKYVVWQGPASPLNCPATLILDFQSTGNESPVTLPCRELGEYLPPASFRGRQPQKQKTNKKTLFFHFMSPL